MRAGFAAGRDKVTRPPFREPKPRPRRPAMSALKRPHSPGLLTLEPV